VNISLNNEGRKDLERTQIHMYDIAKSIGNDYVGTEHLLLGLLQNQPNNATRVLSYCGVDLEDLRTTLKQVAKEGSHGLPHPNTGVLPAEHELVRVLQRSEAEATLLRRDEPDTAIVVLAMFSVSGSVTTPILQARGITYESLYNVIAQASR